MSEYKRNQVEEAISRVLEPRSKEPSQELRIRMKRLLEMDRALGRTRGSTDPECARYAFFSSEAPGSGVEVWFAAYEAFALLNGLRLMGHGWPQGLAVSIMRRVRPELEGHHARILRQDPTSLFDQEAIRRNAREGDMAFDNTDPVLLTIVSKSGSGRSKQEEELKCAIHRGPKDAMRFVWGVNRGTGAYTMFELVGVAHRLSQELTRTEPRPRGRGPLAHPSGAWD
jgi:hypothetical protein